MAKRNKLLEQEDVLQAVVLADSFNVRFAPITKEKPREAYLLSTVVFCWQALLPLGNVPLLAYTVEFLIAAGVQDILVFCKAHPDQIKSYIKSARWSSDTSQCSVRVVVSEDCRSLGDALRDLDAKSLIRSDFVLVNGGDVVSNMSLKHIIELHKERRKRSKMSVMTLVFAEAAPGHHTRCKEGDFVVAVDSKAQQVLHYQNVQNKTKIDFPLEMLEEHSELEIRYDLMDPHISICSTQVPELFTDNFDYQTRDDFIRGILVSEEILGNQIHMHVVTDKYAARVSNLLTYEAISKDVIKRWTYPLVPDSNLCGDSAYVHHRHNIYLDKNVTLNRGCVLKENVIVGRGTSIGTNTFITNSVLGRNCQIGDNVVLEDAYVWDRVCIAANCKIYRSILCDRVQLKEGVTVKPGCLLSYNVVVGPNATLLEGSKLTTLPPAARDEQGTDQEESTAAQHQKGTLGAEGQQAFLWTQPSLSEDEDDEFIKELWGLSIQSEEEESSSSDESLSGRSSEVPSPPLDDTKLFYNEVLDSFQRCIEENINADNLVLEVNSSKYAYNITMKEVNQNVTKVIFDLPHIRAATPLQPAQLLSSLKSLLQKFLPLLKNYIKSTDSQLDCLSSIEESCITHGSLGPILAKILHLLYESDVLSEQVIMQWFKSPQLANDEPSIKTIRQHIRNRVASFVKWLEEAEEESGSSSDED